MKISLIFLVLLYTICSCKQDEELITGPIIGTVHARDQYCSSIPAPENATIRLFKDTSLIGTTTSNVAGQYIFEDVPYGRYSLRVDHPGYIQTREENPIYHIGGQSPTLTDLFLSSVPDYQLTLDSLRKMDNYIVIFLKYNGDTLLPANKCGMALRVFAGNSPDVNKDNYVACSLAYLSDYAVNEMNKKIALHAQYMEWEMESSFEELKNDIIYMRIYPIASGQGTGRDYYPGALGLPSNVISFRWEQIGNR